MRDRSAGRERRPADQLVKAVRGGSEQVELKAPGNMPPRSANSNGLANSPRTTNRYRKRYTVR